MSLRNTLQEPTAGAVARGDDERPSHEALAERFCRGIYSGETDVIDELAADDFQISYPIFEALFGKPTLRGRQAVKEFSSAFAQKWTDQQLVIEETVAAADRVVFRWSFLARDVGSRPGGPPATNRVHRWTGMTLYRFDGAGKIVEELGEESQPRPVGCVGADR